MTDDLKRPILVCFDGSEESRRGLQTIRGVLTKTEVVILTVWQPLVTKLAETGSFGVFALEAEGEVDLEERGAATKAAEEAAAAARDSGHQVSVRVEQADGAVWLTIKAVADEIDAALIVLGTRGRGSLRTALLGSVSRSVLQHAGRPVLIAPAPEDDD